MIPKVPAAKRLRVIKGGGRSSGEKRAGQSRPANLPILLLGLFLLAQVLMGWIWGAINSSAGRTVIVTEGSVDISFTTGGILTFDEELVFAPQSGFVQYRVEEGERVPVGKELAVISAYSRQAAEGSEPQAENGDYWGRFRRWLLDDRNAADPLSAGLWQANNRESSIISNRAGLVSLHIDGWEMFGPESSYIYLTDEEFKQKEPDIQIFASGTEVSRFMPIMRIIDNYCWYYSTILPSELGKIIANETQSELHFSFAPGQPVYAEVVEVREKEGGDLEITWRIDQAAGDYYNHRWCTAEIVYDSLEGVLIPGHTLLEVDGEKGVYIVEKGTVVFKKVILLSELEDDYFLVEGLNAYDRIIARPGRVKEGQRVIW